MEVKKRNIMTRYFFVVLIMALVGIAIVVKASVIMFGQREYWQAVAERFVNDSIPLKPNRGNILSAGGKLMASSLPEYRIYMDFMSSERDKERREKDQARRDALLKENIDSICRGLHRIFPDKSVAQFKAHLQKGRKQGSRNYLIYPKRISYIEFKEVKKLPVFNLNKFRGGFHEQAFNNRKKPFGSLASRTLGDLYADTAQGAKNGIELAFDTVLKGRYGIAHRQKVMNRYLTLTTVPPVDGCDVVTTLDVDMQDICEKALVDELKAIDAAVGVAVLMEVKTGEVKAIVNMTRAGNGNYYEMRNNAISDMMEPGSTFKTASVMVALEDGKITPHTIVDTGNGQKMINGRLMKDHNWYRGGYGVIDVTRILEVSSNIGVSYLIEKNYGNNPQKFVDGLKRMSINLPLHLQIPGEGTPNVLGPKDGKYFANTTLPWMSIGYETQLPPLNILTFYNAIANNGKMVRPKFVKEIVKDGEVLEEFPTEVINEKICSDKTLGEIHTILERVVSHGLAKPAGNKDFLVAGKTGTAQIWESKGKTGHLVSFCGYFPADNPKYSCIVSIQHPRIGYPSGGGMAGKVFGQIATRVYAQDLHFDVARAADSASVVIPAVKSGDIADAYRVLADLDVATRTDFTPRKGGEAWGYAQETPTAVVLTEKVPHKGVVPNVIGMGAGDAVFLLESKGMKASLTGVGKVIAQSVSSGSPLVKGQTIRLELKSETKK
jgi:cell division protein FtsI (penicillin-binding protein 3)